MNNKYIKLKEIFVNNADSDNSISMAKYMQNKFIFFGIPSKKRQTLEKDFISNDKKSKTIDWDFLDTCYKDSHREMQYFVLDYLEALRKYLTIKDINHLEEYVKIKQWWDSIDHLDKIIGEISYTSEELNKLMLEWSVHENIWYRRLAIDHQQQRKANTNKELLEEIILNNLDSKEFFINKAIGWSLRDYSKYNPDFVRSFLEKYYNRLSNLSYKEASKYL